MNNDLMFLPKELTQDDIVQAVRRYKGFDYNYSNTFSYTKEGVLHGTTNCFGLLFLAARDLGLVSPNFDLNLSPSSFGDQPRAKTLRSLLRINCNKIEWQMHGLQPGDVMLMRWHDVDKNLREPHHVCICTAGGFPGHMLHALDAQSGGNDKVIEHRISALDYLRLDEVWRMKVFA